MNDYGNKVWIFNVPMKFHKETNEKRKGYDVINLCDESVQSIDFFSSNF